MAKLRTLWGELNSALKARGKQEITDLLLVGKVLDILPAKFKMFKSGWLLFTKTEEKSFQDLATQLLVFAWNCKEGAGSDIKEEALLANSAQQKKPNSAASSSETRKKKTAKCKYCLQLGHWVKQCKK